MKLPVRLLDCGVRTSGEMPSVGHSRRASRLAHSQALSAPAQRGRTPLPIISRSPTLYHQKYVVSFRYSSSSNAQSPPPPRRPSFSASSLLALDRQDDVLERQDRGEPQHRDRYDNFGGGVDDDSDLEYERAATLRVLQSPAAFGPETRLEAEELLVFWYRLRTAESVSMSLQILDRLVREEGGPTLPPDTIDHVLNNWRVVWWQVSRNPPLTTDSASAQAALAELDLEEEEGLLDDEGSNLKPHASQFEPLATGVDEDAASMSSIETPRTMFQRIMEYHRDCGLNVTEKMFYLILEASVRNGDAIETARLADDILYACLRIYEQTGWQKVYPTTELCNLVLRAYAFSTLPDATQKCEELMEKMEVLGISLNRRTYFRLLTAYGNTESVDGALAAEKALRRMWRECQQGLAYMEPSYSIYASVILAWARSGAPDAAQRGEALLEELRELSGQSPLFSKETPAFNAVLTCYANQGTRRGASRALELLLQQEKSMHVPDFHSYQTVLYALSQVGEADRAEKLLNRVPEMYLSTVMFNSVLVALARSRRAHAVDRARALVNRMKRLGRHNPNILPDMNTYNSLLDCHARCKGPGFAGTKSEAVFEEMLAEGFEPNGVTFTNLLHVWAQYGHPKRAMEVLARIPNPSMLCYNIVLSAFVRSKDPQAAASALGMLRDMIQQGFKPDSYSYTSVIASFASSADKNRSESARQAVSLLREMQQMYQQGNTSLRPARPAYNAVMNAFARANQPEQAEQLLQEMYDDYLINGNTDACPDVSSFNTVLKSWVFSRDKVKAHKKVLEIMERMEELSSSLPDVAPNVVTYTTQMLSFAFVGRPKQADEVFRKIEALHREGKLAMGPSKTTFATLKKAWVRSREPGRNKRVAEIEREMKERFGSSEPVRARA